MHIKVEYRHGDEKRNFNVDNVHGGRTLAENVRRALESMHDDWTAIAVWVDGEQVL